MIEKIQKVIKGFSSFSYQERLCNLKIYSLQHRRERYFIIYVWHILEKLVRNLVKSLQFYISDRRSRLCSVSHVRLGVVVYPLPWPLLVGGVRCSRLWSTSQLLRPSGQQCSHSGGVCPQIQGRQCGAYVGAVEEMMCVVCVDVTEGA